MITGIGSAVVSEDRSDVSLVSRFDDYVDDLFEQHLRGRAAVDRLFYVASELGDFSLIWHLLGAAQGAVRDDGFERMVRLSASLGVESVLVNGLIKSLFRRERPVFQGERPHNLRTPRTTSFPSGHASSAFLAATLLSDRSRGKPMFFAVAAVVATSRIHVRIHHASDVAGGMLIGLGLGALVKRVTR
jgi:undecaprenyl-diphosphatase